MENGQINQSKRCQSYGHTLLRELGKKLYQLGLQKNELIVFGGRSGREKGGNSDFKSLVRLEKRRLRKEVCRNEFYFMFCFLYLI